MTQAVNVEYEELMARATEIEQPIPEIPTTNPQGPCGLSFVNDAATQLAINADSLRTYLKACEREWKNLAESLRNAAKAYEEVDKDAADAVESNRSVRSVTPGTLDDGQEETLNPEPARLLGDSDPYPYYPVKDAAKTIETGDQGAAFKAFADEWDAFQRGLQKLATRFRPFTAWEGDARALVEQNFDAQRQWISSMAQSCVSLAGQAIKIVDAHKKVTDMQEGALCTMDDGSQMYERFAREDYQHPTLYEIAELDRYYGYAAEHEPDTIPYYDDWYQRLQDHSETALDLYKREVALPLLNSPTPPTAAAIAPPPDPSDDPVDPNIPDVPSGDDVLPDATGMPSMPSAGLPSTPNDAALKDAALKDALKGGKGIGLPKGAGLKPASLGGAGSFGGRGGVPSMPLQPPLEGESSRPAGAAAGKAGLGRGVPGLGGAAGGMGGGMPMGGAPGGKGQDGTKGKRIAPDDEAIYKDKRPWTEGVIGNRPPRKSAPDSKAQATAKTPPEPPAGS